MAIKRDQNIHLKLTAQAKAKYNELAESRDKTLSELIRCLLNEACETADIK